MISCEYCRSKHLKCDEKPRCARCERANLKCIRESKEAFQSSSKSSFRQTQTWVPVPPKVDFIFEGPEKRDSQISSPRKLEPPSDDNAIQPRDNLQSFVDSYTTPPTNNSWNFQTPQHEISSASAHIEYDQSSSGFQHNKIVSHLQSEHLSSPFSPRVKAFLSDVQDVRLFRHFIDHLSHFFDFVDGDRHFAREVPQRARHNKPLKLAILALTARHLNRTSSFDSYVADQLLQACVELLIPYLGDANAVADDSLFAAVVILRFLEEVNVPIAGADPQGHLVGTQALIAASQRSTPKAASSLRRACYGCAFRQELYISMMQQRAPQWRIPSFILATEPSDDWSWARRAVEQVADVLQYAFGNDSRQSHTILLEQIESWQNHSPPGFEPLLGVEANFSQTQGFSPIYLQLDCHALGRVYNLIAHALLTAYGPRPKIGPSRKQAIQEMDNIIRDDIRLMCGVAIGNPQAPGACLVASMAIALLGDRFENLHEQRELHLILMNTEIRHGWPTEVPRKELEMAWSWTD